ncbi:MAG: transcriptional regulator [Spirochaetes bacterium]|nr:transcriptional regulator [Spirochaetota bacterium]
MDELNKIIHSKTRLSILTYLYRNKEATFNELKEKLDITDGNLSINLSKLEEAKYIIINKTFLGKVPLTKCKITNEGEKAFIEYINSIEKIINEIKKINNN